jgi:hypothetical protein
MDVQTTIKLATVDADGKVLRSYTALTRDISACGVGLFQYAPAETGSFFLIGLPYRKAELVLRSSVRFCRPLADGLFGVGAQFEALADKATIEQLQLARQGTLERIKSSILD